MKETKNGGKEGDCYTRDDKVIIDAEKKYIDKGDGLYGLALSGGGIRSAAFGLGVMQGLVAGDALKKIDYLSTVSGGGYIGSALTWFLHIGKGAAGCDKKNFPLGVRVGDRTDGGKKKNAALNFIRQHCNYLLPGKGLDTVSLLAVVMRSMFISLLVYLTMLTIGMYVMLRMHVFDKLDNGTSTGCIIPCLDQINYIICAAIFISVILLLFNLLFSILTRLIGIGGKTARYMWFIFSQRLIGWGWKIVFGLLILGSLQYAGDMLGSVSQAIVAGGSTIAGVIMGFLRSKRERDPSKTKSGLLQNVMAVAGVSLLIYGLLLIAYTFANNYGSIRMVVCLILLVVIFGVIVNLNYVGLYRMYRDRLMETFLPDEESVMSNQWNPAKEADKALLENMCTNPRRPYHLINTNIVLVDSPTSRFRGRGGDSFTLSPLYCGSSATGWRYTNKYMKKGTRGMTLSTAMAISAAAVNPNAGVAGQGLTRNKLVSTLMSLLNIRTGYWALNPEKTALLPFPPNFFIPGLKGVLGCGLSEKRRAIELTDGGHFENLALYELIRRKLSVIIVSDAGADPDFHFGDLANAVERVRVDFGAKIRFQDPEMNLEGVLPGSEDGLLAVKYNLAKRGFAIADILYHDGTKGHLIYLKTTLTKGLPTDIYGYRNANPKFPDQSTADQFFDESQFEAYRELGYQLTWQMLGSEAAKKILSGEDNKPKNNS